MDKLFSVCKQWVDRYSAWFFFGVGVICFIISAVIDSFKVALWLVSPLQEVGKLILVGGVFSAVVKSYQFTNVFRQQIEDIMVSASFFEAANRITELWSKMGSAAYASRLPAIAKYLGAAALQKMVPMDRQYYISQRFVDITIRWKDRDNKIVELHEEMNMRLTSASPEAEVPFRMRIFPEQGMSYLDYFVSIKMIKVGGDYVDLDKETKPSSEGGVVLEKILKGKTEYKIERHQSINIPLQQDPCYQIFSENYVLDTRVTVKIENDDIKVFFVEIGSSLDFEERDIGYLPPNVRGFVREYEGLIFPGQGFMLVIQAV